MVRVVLGEAVESVGSYVLIGAWRTCQVFGRCCRGVEVLKLSYEEFKEAYESCLGYPEDESTIRSAHNNYNNKNSLIGCPNHSARINAYEKASCDGLSCRKCWRLCIGWYMKNEAGFWKLGVDND